MLWWAINAGGDDRRGLDVRSAANADAARR
jgi:hypothetical protein